VPLSCQSSRKRYEKPEKCFVLLLTKAGLLPKKGWAKGADGIAALSILLLQDLAVAPMLVILPLIAGGQNGEISTSSPVPLGLLIGKATVGFGGVLALASILLRQIYQVVARFGSAQTFIAATLLVAAGMGIISDNFGLSSTTGAFAAGVLLAESGYRAQIEADIKPFEGILLGVFFVTAGASLDPATVLEEGPTLLAGIGVFCAVKFGIVLAAGNFFLGLTRAEALRVAILLAGGGEFAFVVFKLANNLGILTEELTKVLSASVIISMSLTPLLGELASWGSAFLEQPEKVEEEAINGLSDFEFVDYDVKLNDDKIIRRAFQSFDEDGSGSISADELQQVLTKPGQSNVKLSYEEVVSVIERFDEDGDGSLQFEEFASLWTAKRRVEFFSQTEQNQTESPATRSISDAIIVCGYGEVSQQLCAALGEDSPYVAFSRDPERISQGVLNGASVVYGNGASPQLIKSVGIKNPKAVVVAYASESRCLEATLRLHEAFPNTPIYVRATRLDRVDELMRAGATKVVVETRKTAQAFRKLVGLNGAIKERVVNAVSELMGVHEDVPYSENELTELAYLCDLGPEQIGRLYALFQTSLNRDEKGRVQLAELRDDLMRQRTEPVDDQTLKNWMGYDEFLSKWVTGDAERRWVSFPEFVRFAADKL
jgi:Kef-type K+ transport system membrane component KefB/voltage-gated potassium channel Kch